MGILRDEVIRNLKNLKLDSISEVVQFAGDTFDDVSHIVHNAIEEKEIPGEKIIIKEGKKIVNKASSISVNVLQQHKDKLPKEIKLITDTVELILESVVDITTNKSDIIDGTATTVGQKNNDIEDAVVQPVAKTKAAAKPKRKYKRRTTTVKETTTNETNVAPKKRGRPRKNNLQTTEVSVGDNTSTD